MAVTATGAGAVTSWNLSGSAQEVAVPAHAAGDILLLFYNSTNSGGSPGLSAGWSILVEESYAVTHRATVAYKLAANSSETLSVTPNFTVNGTAQGVCVALTGNATDDGAPFIVGEYLSTTAANSTATQSHPTVTPSVEGSALILFRACNSAQRTFTTNMPDAIEQYDGPAQGVCDMAIYSRDGGFTGAQSYTTTANAVTGVGNAMFSILVHPPLVNPVDLGAASSASLSSSSAALNVHTHHIIGGLSESVSTALATELRVHPNHQLSGASASSTHASATTLELAGAWILSGSSSSSSSAAADPLYINHQLASSFASGSSTSAALSVNYAVASASTSLSTGSAKLRRSRPLTGASASSSSGASDYFRRNHFIGAATGSVTSLTTTTIRRNYLSAGTSTSLSEARAINLVQSRALSGSSASQTSLRVRTLRAIAPPPYATYEFFIDWNRDGGLRISDFETDFDGWEPTDMLSLSEDFSYSGQKSLKATWPFKFGNSSITYNFTGLTIGTPYTFSVWIYVPSAGGQHVKVGVRHLVESDPTTETDKWIEMSVDFVASATEHELFIDTHGTVTNGITYIDYAFCTSEFENVTTQVRSAGQDVSWSYGRDQSRALNPTTPAETELTLDNQLGHYSPNNAGSPVADFLLPNREALVRATYNGKVYDLFRGYLDDIELDPSTEEQSVTISCIDPLAALASEELSTKVYKGQRTGDAINIILDEVGWPANRRDIDPGASVIQYFWVEGQDAADAIQDVVNSEGPPAYATISDAGYFVFRDRHHRILNPRSNTVQATFNAATTEPCFSPPAEINVGWKDIINSVTLPIDTYVTSGSERGSDDLPPGEPPVVWSFEGTFSVIAGQTREFHIKVDSPVLDFRLPDVNKGDYLLISGDPQFTLSRTSGQSTVLSILAASEDVHITNLYVRGYQLNTQDGLVVKVENELAQQNMGQKSDPDNVQAPWANEHDALAIGQIITRTRGRRLPTMSITLNNGSAQRMKQILNRRLSDLIHIVEPRSFTDHEFYIESIEHEIRDAGKYHQVTFGCERVPETLDESNDPNRNEPFTFDDPQRGFDQGAFDYDTIPTDPDDVFILDVSELDTGGLGF